MLKTFNLIEGVVWCLIALVLFHRYLFFSVEAKYKKLLWQASLVFLLFGISDFIEIKTGSWWNPPSLFALKAACVLAMGWLFKRYLDYTKEDNPENSLE